MAMEGREGVDSTGIEKGISKRLWLSEVWTLRGSPSWFWLWCWPWSEQEFGLNDTSASIILYSEKKQSPNSGSDNFIKLLWNPSNLGFMLQFPLGFLCLYLPSEDQHYGEDRNFSSHRGICKGKTRIMHWDCPAVKVLMVQAHCDDNCSLMCHTVYCILFGTKIKNKTHQCLQIFSKREMNIWVQEPQVWEHNPIFSFAYQ